MNIGIILIAFFQLNIIYALINILYFFETNVFEV